jgi:hypothetical protein
MDSRSAASNKHKLQRTDISCIMLIVEFLIN